MVKMIDFWKKDIGILGYGISYDENKWPHLKKHDPTFYDRDELIAREITERQKNLYEPNVIGCAVDWPDLQKLHIFFIPEGSQEAFKAWYQQEFVVELDTNIEFGVSVTYMQFVPV